MYPAIRYIKTLINAVQPLPIIDSLARAGRSRMKNAAAGRDRALRVGEAK